MRDDHIIKLLEESPLGSLSESQQALIASHTSHCSDCARAYSATLISAAMLKARASETVEPSPFFKTRVMAAIRERQSTAQGFPLLVLWKASRALVTSMVALVIVLLTLTLFINGVQPPEDQTDDIYSAEWVVLKESDIVDDDITYGDVLTTLYDSQEAYEQYK